MAIPAAHPYQATSRLNADWDREDGEEGEACYQPSKIGEREGGTYRHRASLVWSSGTAGTISPFSQIRPSQRDDLEGSSPSADRDRERKAL
jgi:hypothetical protein